MDRSEPFVSYVPQALVDRAIQTQDTDPTAKRLLEGLENGTVVITQEVERLERTNEAIKDIFLLKGEQHGKGNSV